MSQWPEASEVRALAKAEGNPVMVVGNRVYDASLLVPNDVHFTRQQYLFLASYHLGVPLAEAAAKGGMTADEADKFLARPKTVAWLQDRAVKDHIRAEWAEGGKWWKMGDECLEGKRHLAKDQQVVFMAFGERVCPKPRETGTDNSKTVINFNFSAEDVRVALRRQEAIETKLAEEA